MNFQLFENLGKEMKNSLLDTKAGRKKLNPNKSV